MQVAADDALAAVKRRLLGELRAGAGAAAADLAPLLEPADWLPAARCLVMRTDEHVAWAPDAEALRAGPLCPRNEAAALALLHAHADALCRGDGERAAALRALSDGFCHRTGAPSSASAAPAAGKEQQQQQQPGGEGGAAPDPGVAAAAALQAWAGARGLATALTPAVFPGGPRGLAAAEPLPAGTVAVSLPAALLITYATARESDLGRALARIPGLWDEAIAVIWTMVERHDAESEAAPFWAALPARFCTGLSAPQPLVDLLAGTPAAASFASARAHLRHDFEGLGPVFRTLLAAYPQYLQQEWFSWPAYLWAVELWYAYAIQVRTPDGAVSPALAPFVSLLNHSPWPHIVRFSEVDAATGCLRLQLLRAAAEGDQVFLSYGPLPNDELILFYGFAVEGNSAEAIAVDLEPPAEEGGGGGGGARVRQLRAEALRRHGLTAEASLRPGWRDRQMERLLPAARVLAATEAELRAHTGASSGGKGRGRGKGGGGGSGRASSGGSSGGSRAAWPGVPLPTGGSEAAAAALIEAAVARARAPYKAALARVEARLELEGNASMNSGNSSSGSGGNTSRGGGGGGGDGGGGATCTGAGAEGEACPCSPAEAAAFLRDLRTLLAEAVALLGPAAAGG